MSIRYKMPPTIRQEEVDLEMEQDQYQYHYQEEAPSQSPCY